MSQSSQEVCIQHAMHIVTYAQLVVHGLIRSSVWDVRDNLTWRIPRDDSLTHNVFWNETIIGALYLTWHWMFNTSKYLENVLKSDRLNGWLLANMSRLKAISGNRSTRNVAVANAVGCIIQCNILHIVRCIFLRDGSVMLSIPLVWFTGHDYVRWQIIP